MDPILQSAILELLQAPRSKAPPLNPTAGDSNAAPSSPSSSPQRQVEIKATRYHLLGLETDIVLKDKDEQPSIHAARIIVILGKPGTQTGPQASLSDRSSSVVEIAAHVFLEWSSGSTAAEPQRCEIILDTDALLQPSPVVAERAESVVHSKQHPSQGNLAKTYHAYISAINARQMTQSLPKFCHQLVTHNGRHLKLPVYQRLMEDAQTAIPDMNFAVEGLVVHEADGLAAALLGFTGTPTGEFAGVQSSGRRVHFGEIVFYWFTEGKISRVVSLVDLDEYRAQVRGE